MKGPAKLSTERWLERRRKGRGRPAHIIRGRVESSSRGRADAALDLGAVLAAVGERAGPVAGAVETALAVRASRAAKTVVRRRASSSNASAVAGVDSDVDARVAALVDVELEAEVEVALRDPLSVLADGVTVGDLGAGLSTAEVGVLLASVADGVVARDATEGALVVVADGVGVGDLGLGAVGVELALLGLGRADALVALSRRATSAREVTSTGRVAESASDQRAGVVALGVELADLSNVVAVAWCSLLEFNGRHVEVVRANDTLFQSVGMENVAFFEGSSEDGGREGEEGQCELGEGWHF